MPESPFSLADACEICLTPYLEDTRRREAARRGQLVRP